MIDTGQDEKVLQEWLIERDRVVKQYDVELFKAFWYKWQAKGIYNKSIALPPDEAIEISLRKMVCNMTCATDDEKKEAEQWLFQHGHSPSI